MGKALQSSPPVSSGPTHGGRQVVKASQKHRAPATELQVTREDAASTIGAQNVPHKIGPRPPEKSEDLTPADFAQKLRADWIGDEEVAAILKQYATNPAAGWQSAIDRSPGVTPAIKGQAKNILSKCTKPPTAVRATANATSDPSLHSSPALKHGPLSSHPQSQALSAGKCSTSPAHSHPFGYALAHSTFPASAPAPTAAPSYSPQQKSNAKAGTIAGTTAHSNDTMTPGVADSWDEARSEPPTASILQSAAGAPSMTPSARANRGGAASVIPTSYADSGSHALVETLSARVAILEQVVLRMQSTLQSRGLL